jgi:pilus assembly protein CpaF
MSLYERLSKARTGQPGEAGAPADAASPFGEVAPRILDPLEALKRKIHQSLLQALGPKLYDLNMTAEQLEFRVRQKLQEVLEEEETPLSAVDRQRLIAETTDDILGYGPIEPFLRDENVTEVMVNKHDVVYVEREGKIFRVLPSTFSSVTACFSISSVLLFQFCLCG